MTRKYVIEIDLDKAAGDNEALFVALVLLQFTERLNNYGILYDNAVLFQGPFETEMAGRAQVIDNTPTSGSIHRCLKHNEEHNCIE